MSKVLTLTLSLALLAGWDIPASERLRPSVSPGTTFSSADEIAAFPTDFPRDDQQQSSPEPQNKAKATTLQERSKLDLIRYVSGEFAKATRALPAGKDGFIHNVGKPLSQELLQRAVATHGAAVNIGDSAQITRLEFHEHTILVDVNGGGRGKRHWRDHIQIGMGGGEVVAAIGKPEHKVRERDSDGNEIEDWIYGQPPSKTVFVRFMGDRVTSIKQYSQ